MSDLDACARCGCCRSLWRECLQCAGADPGHQCDDEFCDCRSSAEVAIICDTCGGKGGWTECEGDCDPSGKHARPHVSGSRQKAADISSRSKSSTKKRRTP